MSLTNIKDQTSNNKTSGSALSMAELMSKYSTNLKPLKKGDIVEGTIKKLTPKEITLDIGAKSDALVLEFDKVNVENLLKLLKVGDKVKASVISPEAEEGFPVVSLRRTLDDIIFLKLEDLFKKQESLEVNIVESTKGGFFAETDQGVKGFLPNSHLLTANPSGKILKVKIIDLDRSKRRLIFSEKAINYLMDPQEIEKIVKREDIVEVTLNNITNHGIYISFFPKKDVEVEGFIHISEVSYQRVEDLQNMFNKGDKIKAQVIDIDRENRRVNLSLKRLEKDNFETIAANYKKDQKVKGIIKSIKTKGITVELEKDVIGFIPESKIPTQSTYKENDEIQATVEDFDNKRRMIILTPVLTAAPVGYR